MPKTKRIKQDDSSLMPIPSWAGADQAVRRIGDAQEKITAAEQKATEQINIVKGKLAVKVEDLQAEIACCSKSLAEFCTVHKDEFGKERSTKLNFGTVGWRKSTLMSVTKKTVGLIKEVFGRKAATYIHVKETPDKEALAKLTDEELAKVGARRRVKDDFFVEPDLTEAANYAH